MHYFAHNGVSSHEQIEYICVMKRILILSIAFAGLLSCSSHEDGAVRNVPFTEVKVTGGFWQPRMETELDVTVPFSVEHCAPAVERFRLCRDWLDGKSTKLPKTHRFISSDMYKVMEGVAYAIQLRRDPKLEEFMDSTIALIAACQKPDGYLYISHICGNPDVNVMGEHPYSYVIHSHELYNMGHLYEAAVAYYQATGKRQLLDVAIKSARHINRVFFEGDPNYNDGKPINQAPGHEEIELALCKLYKVTGDRLYLDMAKRFLDIRGITFIPDGEGVNSPTYAQQHQPVASQREAVGHCVRAIYLYTGMAQVDALAGIDEYKPALDTIWDDLVSTKMHITGGLGADRRIEGFGSAYDLPNKFAYNETCAAVSNVFFNMGMFLAEKDAKYLDVAELSLFNNALAGISLGGDRFFYVNPLEVDAEESPVNRSEWFGCACCPPNISRLILQVPGYMYACSDNDIYVTLYASNETNISLGKCNVGLSQTTDYPYDGRIRLAVSPDKPKAFSVRLRIPQWSTSETFAPGGLYTYVDGKQGSVTVLVNGKPVDYRMEKGFAVIDRKWNDGDVIDLDLGVQPRLVKADDRVAEDKGCVAVVRGPVVYCAENVGNNVKPQDMTVSTEITFGTETISGGNLNGIVSLVSNDETDGRISLIPYFSWDNRSDKTSMRVWLKNQL